jgi:peptidoglycan/LPS O-acetylase OafA/YrhL
MRPFQGYRRRTPAAQVPVSRRRARPGRLGYNPALDGVRALAVLAVLGYHMNALGGGYLGVDVFLVLSGFLITGVLLAERDDAGRVSMINFYVRRGYRLLPAFFVFVTIGTILVVLLKGRDNQRDFLNNAVTSLLYVNNYFRVLRPASGGAWFGHTWSLSLEEQFYLLWPAALLLLCRSAALRRWLPELLLGTAVAVLAWRDVLIGIGVTDSRIYFGLDTRADALLVGCALAAWRHDAFRPPLRPRFRRTRRRDDGRSIPPVEGRQPESPGTLGNRLAQAGPAAMVLLAAGAVTAPDLGGSITLLDRGGYTLVALAAGLVILSADRGRPSWLTGLLSCRPLSWLGRISYGFYLWHFPVTGFVGDKLVGRLGRGPSVAVATVLSTGLAATSYYLVERPARRRRPRWAAGRSIPAQREAPAVPVRSGRRRHGWARVGIRVWH